MISAGADGVAVISALSLAVEITVTAPVSGSWNWASAGRRASRTACWPAASAARASGEPTMTASAPMASALAMSPLRVMLPSAITCAYRPPDSSR